MKKSVRFLLFAVAVVLGTAHASHAQDPGAPVAGRWEISAFPGGGIFFTRGDTSGSPDFGGYALGGAFTFNVNRWVGVEGEVGGGLSVNQDVRFGGTTLSNTKVPHSLAYNGSIIVNVLGDKGSVAPYVAGGAGGLTFFNRDEIAALGLTKDETFLAGNVGGGVKWFLSPHVGVRGDYRLFVVNGRDDAPAFFGLDEVRFGHRVYGGLVLTGGR